MGEERILAEEEISYEGLFDAKELYRLMEDFFRTKSYDKLEPEHREQVTEEGKDVQMVYQPYKKVSDYFKIVIKIEIAMRKVTDVVTEIDGKKKHLKKGEVSITFTPRLVSDYEGRWEQKASYYLFRTVMDKFVYKKQTQDFEAMAMEDTRFIKDKMGAYLNLTRFRKK